MSKKFKILYGILFLALMIQPHIIRGHVAGLDASYAQSLVNILIFGAATVVYFRHERDVKAKARLELEQARTVYHLTNLSAELGLANCRLPLLHIMTTDMLTTGVSARKNKQTAIQELLSLLVVSLSQSDWGLFRFVDTSQGRTIGEFVFNGTDKPTPASIIGNKKLLQLSAADDNDHESSYQIVATSDHAAAVKCYYIVPRTDTTNRHRPIIQNVVDQAQIMYKYLYK